MSKDNEWYIQHGGNKCPFCTSSNITSDGHTQTDDKIAWQEIKCINCNKIWNDLYKLVGFEEKG